MTPPLIPPNAAFPITLAALRRNFPLAEPGLPIYSGFLTSPRSNLRLGLDGSVFHQLFWPSPPPPVPPPCEVNLPPSRGCSDSFHAASKVPSKKACSIRSHLSISLPSYASCASRRRHAAPAYSAMFFQAEQSSPRCCAYRAQPRLSTLEFHELGQPIVRDAQREQTRPLEHAARR